MNNTQCPYCETIFSVDEDLVQALDARARCGMCRSVFNARDQLLREAVKVANDPPGIDDDTVLDFDEVLEEPVAEPVKPPSFSLKTAKLPESDPVPDFNFEMNPDTRENTAEREEDEITFSDDDDDEFDDTSRFSAEHEFDPDDVEEISLSSDGPSGFDDEAEPDDHESDDESVQSAIDRHADNTSDDSNRHNETFELLGASAAPPVPKTRRIGLWILISLILLLAVGGQWVYANRAQLLNKPELRPVVEQFCGILDCQLEPLRNIDGIELLRRSVYSHPNIDKALIISLALINNADFAQPFPILRIRMADVRGQIVAQRDFEPDSYLDAAASTEQMAPGVPLTVTLEIHDPGNDALTFELEFL